MPPLPSLRVAAMALLLTGLVSPSDAGAQDPGGTQPPAGGSNELVTVVVKLDEEPVATYRGTIRGLAATSPRAANAARLDPRSAAVVAYRSHLARKHETFARAAGTAIPAARVLYGYDLVIGGVAMQVPESALASLQALPGVVAVYRDTLEHPDTDLTPAFIGAKAVWGKLGGQEDAGEGVIVGVIDTGIWPEHPSLADPDPSGKPYTVPPGTRTCAFDGGANPGAPFACNGKLIGAYRFMTAYEACGSCVQNPDDFSSARDGDGHGTHTSTTAAGNGGVLASVLGVPRGTVSGIAPRAHVIAYKVCGESGCRGSDSAAAIQQAILDGVDVINFSISGGSDPYNDVVELAFLDAYASGVFVATSAGNDGPTANTVAHRGGWVTSVAASTDKKIYLSKLALKSADGAKLKIVGSSITSGIKEPAPFVLAASVGDATCENATADGAFTGMIVGCRRGGASGRALKSVNVAQRGAVGMVLFNDSANANQQGLYTDNMAIPSVQIDAADGVALGAFASAHGGITATFTQGKPGGTRADVIAAFSSRGGSNLTLGILKPDVTAPGVQILAGNSPAGYLPEHRDGELFQAIHGTSMSSPHVAGAAALLRAAHPDWSPGRVKSALMTTALTKKVVREDKTTPFTPYDGGAGRITLKPALTPGATFDVPADDFRTHAAELWKVNHPSLYLPTSAPASVTVERTLQSELAKDSVWKLSVVPAAGLTITVPPTVTLPAGGTATFPITVDKSALAPGAVAHAALQLKGKGLLHLPITAVGTFPLPNLRIADASISSPLTTGQPATLTRTLENAGNADAAPNLQSFYLSADTRFDASDVFIGSCQRTIPLGAGLTSVCSFTAAFAPVRPVAAGAYYLLVTADSTSVVVESNEADNLFVSPTTVTVN